MHFITHRALFVALPLLMLVACGGGDQSNSSVQAPTENNAPNAVDDAISVNDAVVTSIPVLENDSDPDGDTLSIQSIVSVPTQGSAEISGDTIVYTPQDDAIGNDTIVYEISDGSITSQGQIDITLWQSFTIEGTIVDSPIANAEVIVSHYGQDFVTTTNANGEYSLRVDITDRNAMLDLMARGSSDNNQDSIVLKSFLGSAGKLLDASGESRVLGSDTDSALNATQVTTALAFLLGETSVDIASDTILDEQKNYIESQKLIDTAGFIKLLVDSPDTYSIEASETIETLLTQSNNIDSAINSYLQSSQLIDDTGNLDEAFKSDLATAINQTVSDPLIRLRFTSAMMADTMFSRASVASSALPHWISDVTQITQFNSNGQADLNYDTSQNLFEWAWQIEDGQLVMNFESNTPLSGDSSRIQNYPGALEQIAAWTQDSGIAAADLQLSELIVHRDTYTLLAKGDAEYKTYFMGNSNYELLPPEGFSWDGDNPTLPFFGSPFSGGRDFRYQHNSLLANIEEQSLLGTWVFPFLVHANVAQGDARPIPVLGPENTIFYPYYDAATLHEDGTVSTRDSEWAFSWSIENDRLILENSRQKYIVTPYKKSGSEWAFLVNYEIDGELVNTYVRKAAQFSDTANQFTSSISTVLPDAYIFVGGSIDESVAIESVVDSMDVWGFQFNSDGTLLYNITRQRLNDPEIHEEFIAETDYGWTTSGNIITMQSSDPEDESRQWEVIAVEDNRILVWQTNISFNTTILSLMRTELSNWPEYWQNSSFFTEE